MTPIHATPCTLEAMARIGRPCTAPEIARVAGYTGRRVRQVLDAMRRDGRVVRMRRRAHRGARVWKLAGT